MKRILVVDDEAPNREYLTHMLESLSYEAETAQDGIEAIAKVNLGFDLVLLDLMMPGMDGFEVVKAIRQSPEMHDIPIVIITGMENQENRIRSIEAGANDFIAKPIDLTELEVRLRSLVKMKEAQDAIKEHRASLEKTINQRTQALRTALEEMAEAKRMSQKANLETIDCLALASDYKDEDTGSHVRRLAHYCSLLATGLKLSPHQIETIFRASPMHDVGKIGIPDYILLKPGKLDPDEWEIMKQHTIMGSRILGRSPSELLQDGKVIALSHHEKWDGSGYPNGLAGNDIPLSGRICAAADVFDALTSARPYKEAFSEENAFEIMREERAKHFDPRILDVFLEHRSQILAIKEKFSQCSVVKIS